MADSNSTPLLTNIDSTPKSNDNFNPIEDIIEPYMGVLKSPQIIQVILVSFTCFFEAQQTFISIFTDAKPSWHCLETPCINQESNICKLPTSAWAYDNPRSSIISEFDLQCVSNSMITGLPASCFFMGCLLGGLFLFLTGDSFGRKSVLSLSCFIMCVASICCAFATNVWFYSASRFVSGFGQAAIGTSALVLGTECVGKKWQGKIGAVPFFMSTLGFLSLPIMAYFNRDYSWRALYLMTSLPGIVYCLLIQFCIYESPRWLFSQGKGSQAFAVLTTFAGVDLSSSNYLGDLLLARSSSSVEKKKPFLKMLVESRKFLKQFLLTLVIGLGIGITYYGMPLGIGNLDSNVYLSSAFNALIEIPSSLVILFTISKWKRRSSILGLTTLGGCCGILCFMLRNWNGIQITLELISLFCACTAYDLILIYTSELFPTSFRNSAVSTVWQSVVLGGVISPVVNAAFANYNNVLPYGIFGVVILSFGILVTLLPETLGASTSEESV